MQVSTMQHSASYRDNYSVYI